MTLGPDVHGHDSHDLVPVVAVVAQREGTYLIGQRPLDKRHGGLWEFPGGKLDPGETLDDAAKREVEEELSVTVSRTGSAIFSSRDGDSRFEIHFVEVDVQGEPVAVEHVRVGWFSIDEMLQMPLAPSDAAFVRWLAER